MTIAQVLTLKLDGINAEAYLAGVLDPDTAALGLGLHSLDIHTGPLDDEVEAVLWWTIPAPSPIAAARAAGLSLTSNVVEVRSRTLALVSSRREDQWMPREHVAEAA